jgi:IS5 family transposase
MPRTRTSLTPAGTLAGITKEPRIVSITYSHDPDAAWLKKGKTYYYGYKAHTAVDAKTGLVLAAHATPANTLTPEN